ncbi:5' nucleotidase, NT5C type [Lacticigenium naphthae]|uniref:5' nucleotidase, NT5C type n=1 Tax=Lacticigenium naphthae TaxID=515351 RepID=UPI0004064323|nr:5'-3'-deoxyribonucleotidase [Lacticigenium naphthae]
MPKKIIAVDMDQVLADMEVPFVELFKREYEVEFDDAEAYLVDHPEVDLNMTIRELYPYINTYEFVRNLPVIKNAQMVLKELQEDYIVYIATAAMDIPKTFSAKYEWLEEHFPFIHPQQFVFCGNKEIIQADYLIDDSIRQLKRFNGTGLLFSSSLNQKNTEFIRVNNWEDVREYFQSQKQ